jgi:hypothetical protein
LLLQAITVEGNRPRFTIRQGVLVERVADVLSVDRHAEEVARAVVDEAVVLTEVVLVLVVAAEAGPLNHDVVCRQVDGQTE